MKQDINLIDIKNRPKPFKQDTLLVFSVGAFAVIFVISVFALLLVFLQKSQISALNKDIDSISSKINSLSSRKGKIVTITNRLTTIKSIVSTRKAVEAKVDTIISNIPQEFVINNFKASDSQVSFSLSSPSLVNFDDLLEVRIPQITKNKTLAINHVDIGSFVLTGEEYSLNLEFYFAQSNK